MTKLNSFADFKSYQSNVDLEQKKADVPILRIAMATCSIAAGAEKTYNELIHLLHQEGVDSVIIIKTGCLGYCYAEPTLEVTLPGKEPVVFGHVDVKRVTKIVEKYIKKGEMVEGVIPVNYHTISE